jgi:hypothetical protein
MLSRVYTGSMPAVGVIAVSPLQWLFASAAVGTAAAVMVAARSGL